MLHNGGRIPRRATRPAADPGGRERGEEMRGTKYKIWDNGVLVPAFTRKPKDKRAVELYPRTPQEVDKGIRYYIPANKLREKP